MKSNNRNKKLIIQEIINRIESKFHDSLVIWEGSGCPDEDYGDEIEVFTACMIHEKDYRKFTDFIWDIKKNLRR